ncbi:MAG: hypothetical protein AB8U27_05925 [Rickettsia conorii subsp. raoultii]|uniref:hypothetical protein n=1 Tax=Rickettsia conorii TaxID=781 RepID=UPI003AF00CAB
MKEQKLFINDMNYINQHYTIKIFGFVPNSSFQKQTEPFCIFNNGVAFANASYITTPGNTEGVQGWCWGLCHKYDSSLPYVSWCTNEDINDIRRTVSQGVNNIFNEVIAGFRNISDIKLATLEEVTQLKDLVANDKVKLGCTMYNNGSTDCSNKEETLEFLNLYISDPTLELYLSPHSISVIGEIFIHKN